VYLLHHPAWHKPFYVIDIIRCYLYLDAARYAGGQLQLANPQQFIGQVIK